MEKSKKEPTEAQRLAEAAVRRKYTVREKRVLPEKFWNMPEYQKDYIQQIQAAHSILKFYPFSIAIEALNSLYDMRYKQFGNLCEKLLSKKEKEEKRIERMPTIEITEETQVSKPFTKKKKDLD